MIADLKPYREYKDSGAPVIGKIPSHWTARRQRDAADMLVSNVDKHTNEGEFPVRLCNYVDVYKNDRIRQTIRFMKASATADELRRFRLKRGDVLITKDSESWNDIGVPSLVEYEAPDLVCGYHLAILRAKPQLMLGTFLFRSLQSPVLAYQFHVGANGVTRYGLSHAAIKSVLLPVPPLDEQSAISRFLDAADRSIRRFIGAKLRLIKLLSEQKHAIVQYAITGGLAPASTPRRPSGVPWLGDVPQHWPLRRLKFLANIKTGGRDTVNRVDGGEYPFFVRSQTVERIDTYSFDGEAVLTAGDGAGVAKVFHYINGRFDYHQRVYRFSNFREITGRFFFRYFSNTLRFEAFRETAKSTVDSLRLPMLQDFPVVIPSRPEQDAITSWIDRETLLLDHAIARAGREIELTREYRARLIADVVTGKLDVREAVASLPVSGTESEPVDGGDETETEDELAEAVAEETEV